MNIGFDYQIFTVQPYGGISRYFTQIILGLLSLGERADVIAPFYRNNYLKKLPKEHVYGVMVKCQLPLITRLMLLGNQNFSTTIYRKKLDIQHMTYYLKPCEATTHTGCVLTVFDMIHEKYKSEFPKHDPISTLKRKAISRADHIIAISNSTKRDLCELFDVPPGKVTVVHLGFERLPSNDIDNKVSLARRPFLLYVGSRSGYKNFERMLIAIASRQRLMKEFDVIAFGGGPFKANENQLIAKLGFKPGAVRQVGGDDGVLGILYKAATALVYPSLYEGFGLPPLEAMALDCPVVTSNSSSLPEVVGSAGEYFDPTDIEAQAESIEKVVFSEWRRQELISMGRRQLEKFSWNRCALETRDVYRHILGAKGAR